MQRSSDEKGKKVEEKQKKEKVQEEQKDKITQKVGKLGGECENSDRQRQKNKEMEGR